ncbi:hypothetical protein B0920_17255 [Massilia sp. KIM]|uniref:hypothetical protein n=1 Tax=Massilia sp. KIM TaxID=1955422 RepID=UPI00098FCB9F|nr:hypothetical protein [Massilia sp. KIM]OON60710.1 hypothetical protein B0920_17255 [Massilia sp. KIM]
MTRNNFTYEKRQRELEKKRKAEEKARRKLEAKRGAPGEPTTTEEETAMPEEKDATPPQLS